MCERQRDREEREKNNKSRRQPPHTQTTPMLSPSVSTHAHEWLGSGRSPQGEEARAQEGHTQEKEPVLETQATRWGFSPAGHCGQEVGPVLFLFLLLFVIQLLSNQTFCRTKQALALPKRHTHTRVLVSLTHTTPTQIDVLADVYWLGRVCVKRCEHGWCWLTNTVPQRHLGKRQRNKNSFLGSSHAHATSLADLELSLAGEESRLDNDGLLGQLTVAEHLEVALRWERGNRGGGRGREGGEGGERRNPW